MTKYCIKCKSAVDTTTERYKKIEDHNEGKLIKKVFMHHSCWEEFVIRKNDQKKLVDKTNELLSKVGVQLG